MSKQIFNDQIHNVEIHFSYRPDRDGIEVFVTGDNGLQEGYVRYALECPTIRELHPGEAAPRLCVVNLTARSRNSMVSNLIEMQRAGISAPYDSRSLLLRSQERLITSLYDQINQLQKQLGACPASERHNPCEETGEAK